MAASRGLACRRAPLAPLCRRWLQVPCREGRHGDAWSFTQKRLSYNTLCWGVEGVLEIRGLWGSPQELEKDLLFASARRHGVQGR